jgi:hypothetical protein
MVKTGLGTRVYRGAHGPPQPSGVAKRRRLKLPSERLIDAMRRRNRGRPGL